MTDRRCDVAIVGAGTAGLAAERAARKAGAKTLLIDDGFRGTTCTTVGCMPSKLLIAAANAAHAVRHAPTFGVRTTSVEIDGAAVMERLRTERDSFVASTLTTINEIPRDLRIEGKAKFLDRTTLAIDNDNTVSAKAVVLATGSRPSVPKMFGSLGSLVLTNETIFELPSLPRSIAVIGAGPLGLELAQALSRLRVRVELFDQADRLAALHDKEVAKALHSVLTSEFPIHLSVKLAVGSKEGIAEFSWKGESSGSNTFERILVAAGRPPDLADLNIALTGLLVDERGIPLHDKKTLKCGNAPIFLAGDVEGSRPVLHEAAFEGTIAGSNAAAFPNVKPVKRMVPLSIMFTDPPPATIGAPPSDATVAGTASYADQGRAKVEARNRGLVRIYADSRTGALTGAVLLGPGMDHIAHSLAWAIERGETATGILELPFYHPTFEEGLKPALREICESTGADIEALDSVAPPGA